MRVKNKIKNKESQEDIAVENKIKAAIDKKDCKDSKPETSNFVKLYTDNHAFITSLEYTLDKQSNKIHEFIFNNWKRAFPTKSFPKNGGTLQLLKVCIQYGYVMQAYKKHGIKPTRRFVENYQKAINLDRVNEPVKLSILDRCEKYNKMSHIIINPIIENETETETEVNNLTKSVTFNEGETEMAKRIKEKKAVSKKKTVAKKDSVDKKQTLKTGTKKEKTLNLLMKRKHSDEDISKMTDSPVNSIRWYRVKLNKGDFSSIGFKKPNPPISIIGGVTVSKGKIKKVKVKKVAKKQKKSVTKKKKVVKKK